MFNEKLVDTYDPRTIAELRILAERMERDNHPVLLNAPASLVPGQVFPCAVGIDNYTDKDELEVYSTFTRITKDRPFIEYDTEYMHVAERSTVVSVYGGGEELWIPCIWHVKFIVCDENNAKVGEVWLGRKIELPTFLLRLASGEYDIPSNACKCSICWLTECEFGRRHVTLYDKTLGDDCVFQPGSLVVLASLLQGRNLAREYYLLKRRYAKKKIDFYQGWYIKPEVVKRLEDMGINVDDTLLYST